MLVARDWAILIFSIVDWNLFATEANAGSLSGEQGSRDGAVVIALASHGPVSNPGPGVISGLSLLLVLVLAPRVFLRVLRFSSLLKNQHF